MYRLARNTRNLVTHHPWDWYLKQAFETANYLGTHNNIGNSRDGLMDGTIFLMLLDDLKREGWQVQAPALETQLKARAEEWNRRLLPFGSEMAWDSTGQEQIWRDEYFSWTGEDPLDSILSYMPSIPNWDTAERPSLQVFSTARRGRNHGKTDPSLRLRPECNSRPLSFSR
jgi:hypothetical protein